MNGFLNRIRLPTLLGLTIIVLGIAAGVYSTLSRSSLPIKAAGDLTPKDVRITNIEDTSATISWSTSVETAGFIIYYAEGETQKSALDDMDSNVPTPRLLHYVSLKGMTPATNYYFKIVSSKLTTAPLQFITASKLDSQNTLKPIVGSVLDGNNFLEQGLVFLEIPGAVIQSTTIKSLGSFIIPLSKVRTSDLSNIFQDTDIEAKLEVLTEGEKKASARLILGKTEVPLGPLKVGEELDLTEKIASPSALITFDLNSDGVINASDHSIVLNDFGPLRSEARRNPKVKGADLNQDGVVDKKDLDIISSEIAKLGQE